MLEPVYQKVNGDWFFKMDGEEYGPYSNKKTAELQQEWWDRYLHVICKNCGD